MHRVTRTLYNIHTFYAKSTQFPSAQTSKTLHIVVEHRRLKFTKTLLHNLHGYEIRHMLTVAVPLCVSECVCAPPAIFQALKQLVSVFFC